MAPIVALEWDAREARVAVGRTRGKDVVVEQAFSLDLLPRDPGQTFADVNIGAQVAAALADRGISRPETLVAVGRASIELRLLQIPPAPPEELPDLVRFQAMRQFATLGDDWSLDFVELAGTDAESVSVLAAAISPELIEQIQATCLAGELAPQHLVLRPFAAAALLRRSRAAGDAGCRLVVDMLADEADLTVLVDNEVAFLRTVRLPSVTDGKALAQAVLGEIRRTIGAAQNQLRNQRVDAIVICGRAGDHDQVKQTLEASLQLPVTFFDPFEAVSLGRELKANLPEHSGRYAPLLGMLANEAEARRHDIDFLNPRRRPTAEGQGRRMWLIAGLAATLMLVLAGLVGMRLSTLDDEIAELETKSSGLDKTVVWSRERLDEVAQIEQFTAGDITWLDELHTLSAKLQPSETDREARVTGLTITARPPIGGRMVVEGYVRESSAISRIEQRLRDDRHRVVGKGGAYDDMRRDFQWRFNETITVVREEDDVLDAEPASATPADAEPVDPTPVDAAPVDATPADAEPAVDATPVDAAPINAAPINAAPVDATPVDAEPASATPADAEPAVDAEPVDAAPVDAEPVDAEPVDAEPVDAEPALGGDKADDTEEATEVQSP